MVQAHGKQELEGGMEQGMDDRELVDDMELVRDKLREARDILAFLVVGQAQHIHAHYGIQLLQSDRRFQYIH